MPNYVIAKINEVDPKFQEWTDIYGMMTDNSQGNSTGNGNLFTAHYAFGLSANGLLEHDKERLTQVYLNNFREAGLLNRKPGANDWYQAHDDIVGLMGADALMNPDRKDRLLTRAVYEYGQGSAQGIDSNEKDPKKIKLNSQLYPALMILGLGKIRWVWNNVQPKKFHVSSWLGRRMEIIATMQMSLGIAPNPFVWAYWAATMMQLVLKPKKDYIDGYTLRFHSALAVEGYGPVSNVICKLVRNALNRDHGDLGQLLGSYFNKPEHPIVELCKGKY